jgi:pyrroloquinoline quinone (PQQ) biosynthesis protein C
MTSSGAFVEDLRAEIAAGRAFGRHPLWLRIADGRLPRAALRPFVVQFFLQVRAFPLAVSALHASCPDARERVELAESLYEEETGRVSGCNVSHPELFIRFGESVGVHRAEMVEGIPLPRHCRAHRLVRALLPGAPLHRRRGGDEPRGGGTGAGFVRPLRACTRATLRVHAGSGGLLGRERAG